MTARDTLAGVLLDPIQAAWRRGHREPAAFTRARATADALLAESAADAAIDAIRAMPEDELAELRPDIATRFYVLREQAAQRGQYLLTTLRAHHATDQAGS